MSDQDTVQELITEQVAVIWDATRMLQNIARLANTDPTLSAQMAQIPVASPWCDLDPTGRRLFEAMLPGWGQSVSGAVSFVQQLQAGGA